MLPFGSKSSGGPMAAMASFYNVPKMAGQQGAMPSQQAPANQMSREQIQAMLMQIPAYAAHVQKNPGFMTSFGQPAAPAPQMAQPMPPQMPPAMPQQAPSQSMGAMSQPGLMQMLMGRFGGQPRVQGLLG